jgi:hypothetical protein
MSTDAIVLLKAAHKELRRLFSQFDMQTMRTGSAPYWALFGSRPSLDRLTDYLENARAYDEIRVGIFPRGTESAGLPAVAEWQAILKYARSGGQLLAVDSDRYPRHFRALTGFHRELARLPEQVVPSGLDWRYVSEYLGAYGGPHNVRLECGSGADAG